MVYFLILLAFGLGFMLASIRFNARVSDATLTTDELLEDLRGRCQRGVKSLQDLAVEAENKEHYDEMRRLTSKAEGVSLVIDYMRSYSDNGPR